MGFISKVFLFPIRMIKWIIFWLIAVCAVAALIATPAEGISALQRRTISQDCGTIRQTLGQIQRADSRMRTYLGTTYETMANRFILPLNLRLVKNNLPTLSKIQTDFIQAQANFRAAYTDYMRELEGLIASDCTNSPDEFYAQLEVVRGRRENLRSVTDYLAWLAGEQYNAVAELKKGLLWLADRATY